MTPTINDEPLKVMIKEIKEWKEKDMVNAAFVFDGARTYAMDKYRMNKEEATELIDTLCSLPN